MEEQERNGPSGMKVVIVVLAVLLVLSAGGLAARYVYLRWFAPAQATVTVPDNLIGEEVSRPESDAASGEALQPDTPEASPDGDGASAPAAKAPAVETGSVDTVSEEDKAQAAYLTLFQGRPDANKPFEARGLLPGDSVTQYFCIKAYHDADIPLYFRAEVTEETKALADVLQVRVTDPESGAVVAEGMLADLQGREFSLGLSANSEGESTVYYRVDVSLDTAVGNAYQEAVLKADFHWYVKDGGLTPPQTGAAADLVLWCVLGASALLLILLLVFKRRKGETRHGQAG